MFQKAIREAVVHLRNAALMGMGKSTVAFRRGRVSPLHCPLSQPPYQYCGIERLLRPANPCLVGVIGDR